MTTGLNFAIPAITVLQFGNIPGTNTAVGGLASANVVTRYIHRIVFDNMAIVRETDTFNPDVKWDYQTSTIQWQLFVGNSNDFAAYQTFGLFGDQGSIEFAQPIQVQPRTNVVMTFLSILPAAAPKLKAAFHMSGGLEYGVGV